MYKKVLNIFIVVFAFLFILIFILAFIRIDKFNQSLLYNIENNVKIILNETTYKSIKNNKTIEFIANDKKFNKQIKSFNKEDEVYYCVIDLINEYKNEILKINIKVGSKTIFDF